MPKLLQINADSNYGSTGRIAEQINTIARNQGWETYFMYGRDSRPSESENIRIGNKFQVIEHYIEHRLFDNDGLASRTATIKMVRAIERISPNIIHLHNIHDHWCNYCILFEYLNTLNTPIVWTQHDCWAFTGGCPHFTLIDCFRWRKGTCSNGCPLKKNELLRRVYEKTQKHFSLKRRLFINNNNLTIVPVSHWLENMLKQSFLKEKKIVTIHNGVDINMFKPKVSTSVKRKFNIDSDDYIIGVSSVWLPYKGWNDFVELAGVLPPGLKLVLVGLDKQKVKEAQEIGIIGIPKTDSVDELAELYSGAVCFCNLTYQDTFPTTNLEALACGTPVVTYRTGGSPEAISKETGIVTEQGDFNAVLKAIDIIRSRGKAYYSSACRERAEILFNKNDKYLDYLRLYESLLDKR